MSTLQRLISLVSMLLFPVVVLAQDGIGHIASDLLEPVSILAGFMSSASIAVGIACLFAAFVKYRGNRMNPLAYPISTVVVLFIIGVVLLVLPFIYMLTESGVTYPDTSDISISYPSDSGFEKK